MTFVSCTEQEIIFEKQRKLKMKLKTRRRAERDKICKFNADRCFSQAKMKIEK